MTLKADGRTTYLCERFQHTHEQKKEIRHPRRGVAGGGGGGAGGRLPKGKSHQKLLSQKRKRQEQRANEEGGSGERGANRPTGQPPSEHSTSYTNANPFPPMAAERGTSGEGAAVVLTGIMFREPRKECGTTEQAKRKRERSG